MVLFSLWVSQQPFFWDSLLQGSKWAHWYLEQNFSQLLLPAELDAGHPPFFAFYLALVWKLFGKSLLVSHLAVLPFLWGIVWQLYRLARYFFPSRLLSWVLLIVLTDATLIGHSSIVSPDLVLCFGFLLALNGLLYRHGWQLAVGAASFGLVSIRGLFAFVAIGLITVASEWLRGDQAWWRKALRNLCWLAPAALLILSYYALHYAETGWWLSTPSAAWSEHRSWIGFTGLLRNVAVLGWRLLDFGHIAIWLLLLIGAFQVWRQGSPLSIKTKLALAIPVLTLLAYAPALIMISNPLGHRYLLPLYLSIALLTCYLFSLSFEKGAFFRMATIAVVLIQLSGHFWIYPRQVAQGWDASLAYLPYGGLRSEMIHYIDEQGIQPEQVGTAFPNIGPMNYIDLSGREEGFVEKNLEEQHWIFYSNVYNDFSDEELNLLDREWEIVKRLERRGVCVILYKKKGI